MSTCPLRVKARELFPHLDTISERLGLGVPEDVIATQEHPTLVLSAQAAAIPGIVAVLSGFAHIVGVEVDSQHAKVDGYVCVSGERPHPQWLAAGILIVASVNGSENEHRFALRTGAAAVIDAAMAPEDLDAVWASVLAGYYPLPRATGQTIVRRTVQPPEDLVLSGRDRTILDALAEGDTMNTIATRLSCSERHARRHTRSLWKRFGVATRAEGLVAAARWGFLDKSSEGC